jgi:hypothetical protein
LVLLGWLVAFYAIPEGLAAPFVGQLGGGAAETGLVLAAGPLGGVLAAPAFTRLVAPDRRLRWIGPLAVGACAVLLPIGLQPGLGVALAIFVISGAFGVYQIPANAAFVARVPNARRAQAFGLANAGLIVGQGIMFIVAGAAAGATSPATVIAAVGGVGTVLAVLLTVRWLRVSRHDRAPGVGAENLAVLRVQAHSPRPVNVRGPVSPRCCPWQCVLPWRAGSGFADGSAPGVAHGRLLSGCSVATALSAVVVQPQVLVMAICPSVLCGKRGRERRVSPRCCPRSAPLGLISVAGVLSGRGGFSPRCYPRHTSFLRAWMTAAARVQPQVLPMAAAPPGPVNGWLSVPVCS